MELLLVMEYDIGKFNVLSFVAGQSWHEIILCECSKRLQLQVASCLQLSWVLTCYDVCFNCLSSCEFSRNRHRLSLPSSTKQRHESLVLFSFPKKPSINWYGHMLTVLVRLPSTAPWMALALSSSKGDQKTGLTYSRDFLDLWKSANKTPMESAETPTNANCLHVLRAVFCIIL